MTGAWAASGAGIVVVGVCLIISRHLHRLPASQAWMHPWAHRAVIAGMYLGGCDIALTALGGYVIRWESWLLHFLGGAQPSVVELAGVFLLVAVVAGLIWSPGADIAWMALALPFVAALSGGHLHGVLTVFPAVHLAQQAYAWIGR